MKRILFLLAISILAISCSESVDKDSHFNNMGSYKRNNSYEHAGGFYTLTSFNDTLWADDKTGATAPMLPLGEDFLVNCTKDATIMLLQSSYAVWESKLDSGDIVKTAMCADSMMNIYAMAQSGNLYSFDFQGKRRWKKTFELEQDRPIFSYLLATSTGIYAASWEGILRKYTFDGDLAWEKKFVGYPAMVFSADDQGTVYFPITNKEYDNGDTLFAIKADGDIKWKHSKAGLHIIGSPTVHNEKIHISCVEYTESSSENYVLALNKKGKEEWRSDIPVMPRFLSASIIDSNIYVVGMQHGLGEIQTGVFSINPEGQRNWKLYYKHQASSPIMIAKNYLAMVARTKNSIGVYFIKRDGEVDRIVPLTIGPLLNLRPVVTDEPVIVFSALDTGAILRIDDTPVNKVFH